MKSILLHEILCIFNFFSRNLIITNKNTNRYKDHVFYNEQILEKIMMGTPGLPLTFSGNNGSKNVIQKLILKINPNRIPYTNQSTSFPTRKCFSIHFLSIKREKKDLLPNSNRLKSLITNDSKGQTGRKFKKSRKS